MTEIRVASASYPVTGDALGYGVFVNEVLWKRISTYLEKPLWFYIGDAAPGYWEAELGRRIEAAHPRHYPARARRWLSIRRGEYAGRIRLAVEALRGRHDCYE